MIPRIVSGGWRVPNRNSLRIESHFYKLKKNKKALLTEKS